MQQLQCPAKAFCRGIQRLEVAMRIPILFCTAGLALILANAVHAQNGRILVQQVFTITDSEAKKLPDLKSDTLDVIRRVDIKELEARSPIRWPGKMNETTPILIFHGTADRRVPARDSLDLASELLRLRHPFRLVMLEGGDHGLTEYISGVDQITKKWLDWYVRDKKKWPSLEPHGP